MTIIIPEFWLWIATACFIISAVLSGLQAYLTHLHTKVIKAKRTLAAAQEKDR